MQQIARSVAVAFANLPRQHRIFLGFIAVFTLAISIWQPHFTHEESSEMDNTATQLHEATEYDEPLPLDNESYNDIVDADKNYIVSSGDTFSSILTQYGIDLTDINAMVAVDPELKKLRIGQSLSWVLDDEGTLKTLTLQISRRETHVLQRKTANSFSLNKEIQKGTWVDNIIKGKIIDSFESSALNAGLTRAEVGAVIKALQWQMDFRRLKKDDSFSVMMSRELLNKKPMQSQILAVRMHTGGTDYFGFRAENGKYYDSNGNGLSQGFLRFPTARQYRVSSNFNPHRLNPVTGKIAPHRGVDFAVPIGTPVLSVGDGEVIRVNKNGGSGGNYVAIRHGRQYMTRYMHLSRVLVTQGQKIKRGQRIALSGNTGRSTGPHLHYEIWNNNLAVNPLTANLPRSEGLSGQDKRTFIADAAQRKKLLLQG